MSFEEHMIYNRRDRAERKFIGRPHQKIRFDQHRECNGCTHAGDTDPESDEPPELDWTLHNSDDEGPPGRHPSSDEHISESEDESQEERNVSAPFGQRSQFTTTQKLQQGNSSTNLC